MTTRKKSPPVRSLDRGLTLLETVARAQQSVSLAELTQGLDIDRSNVYRLANTLVLRGFLAQLPGSREYVLGPTIGRLSSRFEWPKQVARAQVMALAARTGETTHVANLFDCVRTKNTPISDVVSQHRAVSTCHLVDISIRLGRKLTWDPRQELFVGDDEANRWLRREQREGFEIRA